MQLIYFFQPSLFEGFGNVGKEQTLTMNKHLPTFSGKACAPVRTSTVVSEKRNLNLAVWVAFSALLLGGPINRLQSQSTEVQFIHAAEGELTDTLDVYVNQVLIANDLPRNAATAFLVDLPAQIGFPLQITLAPEKSASVAEGFFSQSVPAQEGGLTTIAFIGNPLSSVAPFQFLVDGASQKVSSDTSKTAVSFLHAAPSAAAFDMVLREGGMVFGALGYGQVTPYLHLRPDDLFLDVKASGTSNILSTYGSEMAECRVVEYRVVGARGVVVLRGQGMPTGGDGQFQVAVSSLATGLYFLEIKTSSGGLAVRFVKM